jgi:hypothetical protein
VVVKCGEGIRLSGESFAKNGGPLFGDSVRCVGEFVKSICFVGL